MKMNGQKIEGPNVEVIVIPRGGDKPDIVFQAQAIIDNAEFDKLCPIPQPPERIMKGNVREKNFEDLAYKAEIRKYHDKRIAWIVITSLRVTEGLEWETVKETDHSTWCNYEKELKDSGFSYVEVQRIQNGVFAANCLNEARVEEARANFLRGPAEQAGKSFGRLTGQNSTPSGELAKDSA